MYRVDTVYRVRVIVRLRVYVTRSALIMLPNRKSVTETDMDDRLIPSPALYQSLPSCERPKLFFPQVYRIINKCDVTAD